MDKERFLSPAKRIGVPIAVFLGGLVLTACAEKVQEQPRTDASPTPPRPIPTGPVEQTLTPTVIGGRPTITPDTSTPPVSGAPRPSGNWALRLDGKEDALSVESSGILLTGPFRIEAKLKSEGVFSGGDTIVSKGDGFAVFARSLRCLGNVGLLLDGQDVCTDVKLGLNTFNNVVVTYDGREVTFIVNGQEILRKSWQGPLQISAADLMIGRRPGVLREPLAGLIDNLRIFENGELVLDMPFDQGFSDISPRRRVVHISGNPKLEVVR